MPDILWKTCQRRSTHIPMSQRGRNMEQSKKGPLKLGRIKQSIPKSNPIHYTENHTLEERTTPQTPTIPPHPLANALKQKTYIGWLQDLMGLISHDSAEVQMSYLISLGAKISGVRWISALIIKILATAWEIWIFRNYTLHATDAPKKWKS